MTSQREYYDRQVKELRGEVEELKGYAAIAASAEFKEEQRKQLALHDKWKAVADFENKFNIDIRDYLAAETIKRTKPVRAPRKKKIDEA